MKIFRRSVAAITSTSPSMSSDKKKKKSSSSRSRAVRLRYAVCSARGRNGRGAAKTNQDAHAVHAKLGGHKHLHLFLVADGHGREGHHVSAFIKANAPVYLEEHLRELPETSLLHHPWRRLQTAQLREQIPPIAGALQRTCAKLHQELHDSEIETALSGSTLVMVLLVGAHAVIANVGDSRCVLGAYTPHAPRDPENNKSRRQARLGTVFNPDLDVAPSILIARPLTVDQEPDSPTERPRIESMGGFVQPLVDRSTNTYVGPQRVWSRANPSHPGLAMARSIADDVATSVGVVYDPVVSYQHLRAGRDQWLIIASDGVWETVGNQDAVDCVAAHNNPTDAAVALCKLADARWEESCRLRGSVMIDDITCLALHLWPNEAARVVSSADESSRNEQASGTGKSGMDEEGDDASKGASPAFAAAAIAPAKAPPAAVAPAVASPQSMTPSPAPTGAHAAMTGMDEEDDEDEDGDAVGPLEEPVSYQARATVQHASTIRSSVSDPGGRAANVLAPSQVDETNPLIAHDPRTGETTVTEQPHKHGRRELPEPHARATADRRVPDEGEVSVCTDLGGSTLSAAGSTVSFLPDAGNGEAHDLGSADTLLVDADDSPGAGAGAGAAGVDSAGASAGAGAGAGASATGPAAASATYGSGSAGQSPETGAASQDGAKGSRGLFGWLNKKRVIPGNDQEDGSA